MTIVSKLIFLFAGHALCDFAGQGDFMAKGKNQRAPIPGVPFYQCLFAHALIHAGMVYLITRNSWFFLAELIIHSVIDYVKCEGRLTFNQDQFLHYGCKIAWAIL